MTQGNSIEIKGISKNFKEKEVLKQININIGHGEIFGLLGPSGAGKTTLIKILTGQLKQNSGSAVVLGEDTAALTDKTYTNLGMVLDNSGLYDRLSCYDNLSLYAKIYQINKSQVEIVLEKVGLKGEGKVAVSRLSKGMKQRLVLARALLHNPKILFMDEPTSGLDPKTAQEIHKLILEQKNKGTTIFLTTHNMEEAEKLCDNVGLLNEGGLREYGIPKEICRRYNHSNRIEILLKNGESVSLTNDSSIADQISEYFRRNMVESIHSTEPNLETVFMELTGRRFE